MDFQDTLMTNKWNQSFLTPDKTKDNSTLQTNPSTNTLVSFNFSKSNLLNESSQIASKQLISVFKIQQREQEKSNSNVSNPEIQIVCNKINNKQIDEFLQIKKLLSYYFNECANMKIKQKASKNKNKDLILKVYDKEKQVARYRQKVMKSIKFKQTIRTHYKSQAKLKRKYKLHQFYQIKRDIKIIDNQIQSTIAQIAQLQNILQKKQQTQSARYSKGSLAQKKMNHKSNIKKLNKKQPIIYLPYFFSGEQYPPSFGFAPNNPHINSLKSSTKHINVNSQINSEKDFNNLTNFNSFGLLNKNAKNVPNNSQIKTQNISKITNKQSQITNPFQIFSNKISSSKKSIRSSVKKWQGDQQDMDVIRLISESQKLKKSAQNREGIEQSVININMQASLKKTQKDIKQKNIINKYELSPREDQQKNTKQFNHNQKQLNKSSKHQLSPRKDQNFRQSSIYIDVESDEHSRSNSYEDSAKDDAKKNKQKRIISSPKNNNQQAKNKIKSQAVRISQQQNSGLSTPIFTGKESPNLKLTNPIFQLQNLVQSKTGSNLNNRQQINQKKSTVPVSPVNIQGINQNSSDQSFMQISLQVQSKVSKQQFKNINPAKSAVFKSKKEIKKEQKIQRYKQKNYQDNLYQQQSDQNDSEDDFMDNVNLLAVSRISKQRQKSTKSQEKNNKDQDQNNFEKMDSQLRVLNPSKIIKKGNPQLRQLNMKNSQRLFSKIPVTVEQQEEYEEQVIMKKISTARNSEPVVTKVTDSQDRKDTI